MNIKSTKFTVGDLAAFYGVSADTIRLYDKKGILKAERNNENDYRVYGKANFLLMDQIIRLRDMGVSLHDINLIINSNSLEETKEFCRRKIEEYEAEIELIQRRKNNLEGHYKRLENLRKSQNDITVEKSPALLIRDFSEGVAISKKWFRQQEKYNIFGEPYVIIYSEKDAWYKVIDDSEAFSSLRFNSSYYMAARLADYADKHAEEEDNCRILPPEMCIHATATYESGNIEKLSSDVRRIMDYAREHNYRLRGPACAWSIFSEKREDKSLEYYDLWFPVI